MIDRETFSSAFLNADCMEVMREYPDNFFDLAIVDPPYGGANADSTRGGGWRTTDKTRFGGRFDKYKKCIEQEERGRVSTAKKS